MKNFHKNHQTQLEIHKRWCIDSYNVDLNQFKADFARAIGGYVSEEYADEKMTEMRNNFVRFFCNFDKDTKGRFVKQALIYYGIED